MQECKKCGTAMTPGASYCTECGAPAGDVPPAKLVPTGKPAAGAGKFPTSAMTDPYCASRLPTGCSPPYYQSPDWSGELKKVRLAYTPSGAFTWKSVALLIVGPTIAFPIAFWLAALPLRMFGWSTFVFDIFALMAAAIASWTLGQSCRNRLVGAIAGAAAGAIVYYELRVLGFFDDPFLVGFKGNSFTLGKEREVFSAVLWCILPISGWFAPGSLPYCEQCREPYVDRKLYTHKGLNPNRALYHLRKGRIPAKTEEYSVLSDDFPSDHASLSTSIEISACPK